MKNNIPVSESGQVTTSKHVTSNLKKSNKKNMNTKFDKENKIF